MKSTLFSTKHEIYFCLFITLVVISIYGQVVSHDFVNYDDDIYITTNKYLQDGLTFEGIKWAFSFEDKGKTYWHPLTWLSHMADVSMFGFNSGLHHLVNMLWHILNIWLLFFLLNRMTGMFWLSAFVTAIFAVHPVNVETVAWASQRKNLLSTFFSFITIITYFLYVKSPDFKRYLVVGAVFVTGLMAKPMLITLPFVLMLLDYWPLQRFTLRIPEITQSCAGPVGGKNIRVGLIRCILEKIPFICIALLITYLVTKSFPQTKYVSFEQVPLYFRIENLIVSYVSYIGKLIWPINLAVLYPYPKSLATVVVGGCFSLLTIITLIVFYLRAHKPLTVGWLWFLGTLIPVSGIVQNGIWPAGADRWLYVPAIGFFLIISCSIQYYINRMKESLVLSLCILMCFVAVFGGITWTQVRNWKNSLALFKHTVSVTTDNVIMHTNLGDVYWNSGQLEEALNEFQEAVRIHPYEAKIHYNIGIVYKDMVNCNEARKAFGRAVSINHNFAAISYKNLGVCYATKRLYSNASLAFREAMRLNPNDAEVKQNLIILDTLTRKQN